jgi:hypothetical protein
MSVDRWISLGLLVATLLLAFATWRTAQAAQSQVDEIKRDREMTWQPILTFPSAQLVPRLETQFADEAWYDFSAVVRNAGGGPALNCRLFLVDREWWAGTDVQAILAGTDSDPVVVRAAINHRPEGLGLPPTAPDGPVAVIAYCEDPLGRRFRFVASSNGQVMYTLPPEVRRLDERSGWAADERLWPKADSVAALEQGS